MSPSLDQWLAWALVLDRLYQDELGRSAWSDPEAFVNWSFHWREHGMSEAEIRTHVRASPEWREKHGEDPPPVQPSPVQPSPVRPLPSAGSGRAITVAPASEGRFHPRMYSYWANTYVMGDHAFVFAGHQDGRARLWAVTLSSGRVQPIAARTAYGGTTEGWYWNAAGWIYLIDGAALHRVNPFTGDDQIVFDNGAAQPGTRLWQAHSSDDGQVHSATVERITPDGPYERLGTVVLYRGTRHFFAAHGALDESQVDRSGEYVLIKEDHDNRIIELATLAERRIADADGALGHSDCGHGFAVGEDNIRGACVRLDLRTLERRDLLRTWNLGHVSVRGDRCLLSDATNLQISLVALDGSGVTPVLTHGVGGDYDRQVRANLDPTGRVATCMINGAIALLVLP